MSTRRPARSTRLLLITLAALTLVAAACGDDDEAGGAEGGDERVTLRLGYFPNVTHAPAIIGVEDGIFEDALGDTAELDVTAFNAGPEAVNAILSGALDASFIGPNPAINAYAESNGEAIRIVAGTASGGAYLVVDPEITSAADLAGAKLATPQLGNTQDVALRAWLAEQGYETDLDGGGDVSVLPQENSTALEAFKAGAIDGAWVPEPWATRLVNEGGGTILVDERDLWPGGDYVTTHLVVTTEFLEDHPDAVKALIEGLATAIDLIADDAARAGALLSQGIESLTSKPIAQDLIDATFANVEFTLDPIASSLATSAEDATELGLLEPVDLADIYDLSIVNAVLTARGEPEVTAP